MIPNNKSINNSADISDLQAMLSELDNIVANELRKNESEQDEQLISDAITEMAELKNVKSSFSKEEIGEIFEQLQSQLSEKRSKKRLNIKRSLIAVCAACLVLVVSACAIPTVRNWILEVAQMPINSSIEVDGITYTNHDVTVKYSNVEELVKTENLDIYYPTVLPDGVYITELMKLPSEDNDCIEVYFNNVQFHISIYLSYSDNMINIDSDEIVVISDLTWVLFKHNDKYMAQAINESFLYIIECPDYESLLIILNNYIKG